MDSVSQATLGAAVGELVLGKKVGKKAPLWGATAGTLPDLDVLTAPFLSESAQLGVHRGVSHSLLFAVVGGIAPGPVAVPAGIVGSGGGPVSAAVCR